MRLARLRTGLLGCPHAKRQSPCRSPHAASGRLLFLVSIAVGLYRASDPFGDLVSTYDLKVNHKPVVLVDLFSETGGLPLDEAPSGAAALPDGRTAALARQARTEISSAAGELAVQCTAGRWRRDRGARGRPRSRPLFAPRPLPPSGKTSSISPILQRSRNSPANWGGPGRQLVERSGAAEITAAYGTIRQDASTCSARRSTCWRAKCSRDEKKKKKKKMC